MSMYFRSTSLASIPLLVNSTSVWARKGFTTSVARLMAIVGQLIQDLVLSEVAGGLMTNR